jgi:uncharacterized protein YcfL
MKNFFSVVLACLLFVACSGQEEVQVSDAEITLEETATSTAIPSVSPGSRLLAPGTKSVTITVTTGEPALVKVDTSNVVFSAMKYTARSSNGTTHTLTVPLQTNQPYSFYVKAAPKSNPAQPYTVTRKVNYRVLTTYLPTFPRLFTLWWPVWGQWQDATPEKLAELSVFIHNLHGYNRTGGFQPINPSVFSKARQLNPSLRILTQLYTTYGCDVSYCDELARADADPSHPLYRKLFIRNANGTLWTYGAGEEWEHEVYNFSNPDTVKFLVQKNLALWRTDLLTFDGAHIDNCWRGFKSVADRRGFGIGDTIDLNLDGVADDPVVRDRAYEFGLQDFLKQLRAGMPNAMITCNAVNGYANKDAQHNPGAPLKDRSGRAFSYKSVIDGNTFETDLAVLSNNEYWQEPTDLMNEYSSWNGGPLTGALMPNTLAEFGRDPNTTFKQMRFGLTFTLMGDGLYLHGGWSRYTMFDEYKVDLGYAAQGFGAPVAAGSPVWRRNFDKGIALVNTSTTQTITVNLGGTYKAIQGTQDRTVNNGQSMTRIRLAPLDGRILLKP